MMKQAEFLLGLIWLRMLVGFNRNTENINYYEYMDE